MLRCAPLPHHPTPTHLILLRLPPWLPPLVLEVAPSLYPSSWSVWDLVSGAVPTMPTLVVLIGHVSERLLHGLVIPSRLDRPHGVIRDGCNHGAVPRDCMCPQSMLQGICMEPPPLSVSKCTGREEFMKIYTVIKAVQGVTYDPSPMVLKTSIRPSTYSKCTVDVQKQLHSVGCSIGMYNPKLRGL
jgi:hypothetical protein